MKKLAGSKSFHTLLGFLISAVLVIWVVREINWQEAWHASKSMHYWVLAPIFLCLLVHFYLRALRWRYLLADGDSISVSLLFDAIMIGNVATYLLPLRAGEFIRPYVLVKESATPISYPAAFTSVVIERFFDLAVVLASFAVVLLFIPEVPEWVHAGAYALSLLGAGILAFIIGGILLPDLLLNTMQFFLKPFPDSVGNFFLSIAREFVSGAHVLKSFRKIFMATVLSLLVWGVNFLLFYVGFWLLDIQGSMLIAVTAAVIVALAVAAPSAPGFVGVIQVSCIASFAIFGISKELAAAYSIILHLAQYVFVCGIGFYALGKRKLSLTRLNESRTATAPA